MCCKISTMLKKIQLYSLVISDKSNVIAISNAWFDKLLYWEVVGETAVVLFKFALPDPKQC